MLRSFSFPDAVSSQRTVGLPVPGRILSKDLPLNRHRKEAMQILLITPSSPFDQSFGGGQRSAHMYSALLQHGTVDVLVLIEGQTFAASAGNFPAELARVTFQAGPWHTKYTDRPDVAGWIAANLDLTKYDLVIGRSLTSLCMAGVKSAAPQLVDVDDAYYSYVPAGPSFTDRLAGIAKTMMRKFLTKRAMRRFDYVWVASAMDLAAYPVRQGGLLPNIPSRTNPILPAPASGKDILFVGAMWYGPNRDAVDWFIANCWTAILAKMPSATFTIVGACGADELARWNAVPGVRALGFVDDLAAQYQRARFTVSPIRFGGGTQIKVLESLCFGRTAVTSAFIYQRYAEIFVASQSLMVAHSADEFIRHCLSLLGNPGRAAELAMVGHGIVNAAFSKDVFEKSVADGVAKVRQDSQVRELPINS